jgi:hypothetical protein
LKILNTKKKTGGVVQGLGPEFKSQYCKKIYDWVRKENKLF